MGSARQLAEARLNATELVRKERGEEMEIGKAVLELSGVGGAGGTNGKRKAGGVDLNGGGAFKKVSKIVSVRRDRGAF